MPGTVFVQRRYLMVIICLVTIGLGFLWQGNPVDAEQPQTDPDLVIRIVPAAQEVGPGDTFVINVTIEGATDLGGFQFDLVYDPTAVTVADVVLGPFIGSTGRTTESLGPTIGMRGSASLVSFGAFAYGGQPGPQGDGILATVTLTAGGSGSSALQLQNVQVTDTVGNVQLASVEGGTVAVAAPAPAGTPTPIPMPTSTGPPTPTGIVTTVPVTTATPTNTLTAIVTDMATSMSSATETAVETVVPATTAVPTMTTLATIISTGTYSLTPGVAASQVPSPTVPQLARVSTAIPTAVAPQSKPLSAPFPDPTPILMNCLFLLGCLVFGGLFTLIAGYGFTVLLSRYRDHRGSSKNR